MAIKTRTGVERRNARMHRMFEDARKLEVKKLGKLAPLAARLEAATIYPETARSVFKMILIRMAEIDAAGITKSQYRELVDGEQDEPPNGDDFNDLWDAVLDEMNAVIK